VDKLVFLQSLTAKWRNFNPRERIYLGIAAIFIVIAIFYYVLISPLTSGVQRLQQQMKYQQDLVQWMQPRVAVLRGSTTSSRQISAIASSELLPIVDTRLKQSSFAGAVGEVSQTNGNNVHITFKQVPFDELMAWLVTQWQTSRIGVTDIDVQKGDKVGMAKVALTLTSVAST